MHQQVLVATVYLAFSTVLNITSPKLVGELDANRPVPFRLTPNIAEFLTATGVTGPLTAAMVSSARCFVQPQYKLTSFLRAMLRDEYITWHKKVESWCHDIHSLPFYKRSTESSISCKRNRFSSLFVCSSFITFSK